MRPQPAHMSRDTDVDDSRCAPPAEPNPANSGANNPCPIDTRTPYERSARVIEGDYWAAFITQTMSRPLEHVDAPLPM